ncbi:MAG TPA: 3-hydroxyacyl-CoA dehydrogenase [Rectinema sp.]|jgi:3-hydroxybutyryl-CoA dehydrogenase|nr:3-hydroxyacyl-CoA dehydrogenase [Rectinema sp.]HOM93265.1 3-hydroxyacyl-CoA dehydrogenase [Rectinema sp.]HOR92212.1 3-hydroxyacyl-CoA dehydrogenase [Rectinema sp.]HPK80032.1 3-hydroxyacyl-CoA dehydrogenase [Rectinema sp.]HQG15654.1 3-hydroxyacyl-CoA dehydrogenase [Rectinema sp.]
MEMKDIKKVLIVGAGTMGQQIAFQCAAHGYKVILYDMNEAALVVAQQRLTAYANDLIAGGYLERAVAEKAFAQIATTTDEAEAAREADLLSESVPENPALKRKVFARFNDLCPSRTVFTTNTSMLLPSVIAEATGRPERFLAFHFHQPVWIGNVADVMPHPGTSAEVVKLVRDFACSINQIPMVLHKENHGYVFNAMYSSLNGAAIALVADGVASVHDVDRAWMAITKMPIGPLGMLDSVGLDTALHITESSNADHYDSRNYKNAEFLKKEYVDKGWLGVKTGRGFYTYPNPAYQDPDFLKGKEN